MILKNSKAIFWVTLLYLAYFLCLPLFFYNIDIHRVISVLLFFFVCSITYKMHLERTSIIHLILLSMFTFVYGRYLVGIFFSNLSGFVLGFGNYYHPSLGEIANSFLLFNTGLCSLWCGLVVFIKRTEFLSMRNNSFDINLKYGAFFLIAIMLVLCPIDLFSKIKSVNLYGYEGLYINQNGYHFDPLRLVSFCLPVSFTMALCSKSKVAIWLTSLFIAVNSIMLLYLGAREAIITWSICFLWVYDHFSIKKIPGWMLLVFLTVAICIACLAEVYRGGGVGHSDNMMFVDFLYKQGFTSVIAIPAWQISGYSKFSFLTMFLPVGGLLSYFGVIKSTLDMTIFNYFAFNLNPEYFKNGHGLGWSMFLDIYHLSGKYMIIYMGMSFVIGGGLSFFHKKACQSVFVFIIYVALLPKLVYLPRSGLFVYTNNAIYYSIILFCTLCISFYIKKFLNKGE